MSGSAGSGRNSLGAAPTRAAKPGGADESGRKSRSVCDDTAPLDGPGGQSHDEREELPHLAPRLLVPVGERVLTQWPGSPLGSRMADARPNILQFIVPFFATAYKFLRGTSTGKLGQVPASACRHPAATGVSPDRDTHVPRCGRFPGQWRQSANHHRLWCSNSTRYVT